MASKKSTETTEEAVKATPSAMNCTESEETAKGNQEPVQEENAAKIENNGITEHQEETDTEDLTIDVLDDLTLPGDADPNEVQHGRRWRISDDGCADWALKKIKAEKDELDRITALAEAEVARLKEQVENAQRRYDQNTRFLTSMLADFFETVPHKKTKTGTESYRLLNGQLVKKPAAAKMQPDDEKLVAWLRESGREDLIKVETKAMWGDLKKQISLVGTIAMIEETGEIVEGIDIVEVPPAFSVKF